MAASAAKSEKALSEIVIAPVLSAVKAYQQGGIGIFSGEPLSGAELTGICDFIITTNPTGFIPEPSILVLVEAKRQDLLGSIPQCIAEMLVARQVNEQARLQLPAIYGCVTTGTEWQFTRLMDDAALVDPHIIYYPNLERVLGTLNWIVNQFKQAAFRIGQQLFPKSVVTLPSQTQSCHVAPRVVPVLVVALSLRKRLSALAYPIG